MEDFVIVYIVGYFIAFLVAVFIVRWIFLVDKRLKYQETQTDLLFKIANKLGVSEDELDGVRNRMKN